MTEKIQKAIDKIDQEAEKVGTFPAACQVDPAVSSFFSRRRQSVQPAFAR